MASAEGKLNVSELDFQKIKDNLVGFMSNQDEFVGYNFKGSSFDVLLDILAYNTHYNAYYANMIANEMFLDSATLRNSVVARAKHLGYNPRSAKGSKALINMQITPAGTPAVISIAKNTQFSGDVDGVSYVWCTSNSHSVNINANGVYTVSAVELTQGVPVTHRYTANTGDKDQKFILPNANVDTDTLSVTIQTSSTDTSSAVYSMANDITAVNATSNVYFLTEAADGKYEVEFGDGVLGKPISNGNIIILSSLICDANLTNGCKSFSVISDVGGYSNVKIVTTSTAGGGQIPEDIEGIKFNAPKSYDAQNRAVTIYDYVSLVKRDYSGAQSVVAWGGEDNDPPVYGKVFVAVKPTTGTVLSGSTKAWITNTILSKRNVVGVTPEIKDPDYLYLKVNATVKYDATLTTNSSSSLKATVTNSITGYGDTSLKDFDKSFRYSNLVKKIDESEVSIKSNQTSIQVKRYLYPLLGSSSAYDLNFSNEIYHPSNTFWGSITSTDFSYTDSANTTWTECKLQDSNGVIQVYRTSGQNRILVDNNIGSVTYVTGKISLLSFAPQAIGSASTGNTTGMEIFVTPASNDILPLREQIILIQSGDIDVTMLDDSGTGTYTTGSIGTVDGQTISTGY